MKDLIKNDAMNPLRQWPASKASVDREVHPIGLRSDALVVGQQNAGGKLIPEPVSKRGEISASVLESIVDLCRRQIEQLGEEMLESEAVAVFVTQPQLLERNKLGR